MNKFLTLGLVVLLLHSCSTVDNDNATEVDCSRLVLSEQYQILYPNNNGELQPYTGDCYEYYPSDTVLKAYKIYENGYNSDSALFYYSNGQLEKRYLYDSVHRQTRYQIWNKQGELMFDAHYKRGKMYGKPFSRLNELKNEDEWE